LLFSPDGDLLLLKALKPEGDGYGIYRIEVATGDRELLNNALGGGWNVYPAPSFFAASSAASLGPGGLIAMLVAGIFIGVQLRTRPTNDLS
jgi:hypothetical protein